MSTISDGLSTIGSGAAAGTAIGGPGIGTAVGAGAGALAAIVSGLMAYMSEDEARQKAQDILNTASARFGGIDDSAIQKAAAQVLPPSQLGAIQSSPQYTQAMQGALSSLKDVSDRGGLSLADKAVTEDALSRSGADDKSRRDALTQNFANKGLGGSYSELAAQLQSQQSTANRDAQTGLSAAGTAQQRALDALKARGEMGAQFQQQEYGQKSEAAKAQDAIAAFNIGRGDNLAQQHFNNQFQIANAQAGLAGNRATMTQNAGQNLAQVQAGVGSQIGKSAGEAGSVYDQHFGATPAPASTNPPDKATTTNSGGGQEITAYKSPDDAAAYPDPDKNKP